MKGEGIRWLLFGLGFGWRGRLARKAALARVTLTLALSHEGLTGVGLAPLGARASRPQSRASARRTLILAFSHKGRRDPLTAICT